MELVNACLGRIDVYNPRVNAFITVMREAALAQARTLDEEQRAGKLRGPLHGIPIALKDNIDAIGWPCGAGTGALQGLHPVQDAELVRRLRAADEHPELPARVHGSGRTPLLRARVHSPGPARRERAQVHAGDPQAPHPA